MGEAKKLKLTKEGKFVGNRMETHKFCGNRGNMQ